MPDWVDLKAVPLDSPHRRVPLGGRAQYRWTGGKSGTGWRTVDVHWRIAKCCFNDLGEAWLWHCEWRIISNEQGVSQ